jgi:hypothetical protein
VLVAEVPELELELLLGHAAAEVGCALTTPVHAGKVQVDGACPNGKG